MKTIFLTLSVALALPSAALAQPAPTAPATSFVAKAAASDLYEIQSSRLALQKSRNEEVRRFAQMMVDHHTKTTQQVSAAAKEAGVASPPAKLEPAQAQMIAALQPLSGDAFDKAYLMQQRTAHEQALALHSDYAERGDKPQLRNAASAATPIVQRHLTELQSMKAR
ncbi:putative membrane protein [Sphingomonas zeicaulis]|uniref:DUF4142 domain-containing protein n=1 Tax=Sphingomonas zeicaulis TaxID=1632740 RepID=UPI003D1ED0FC